METERCPFYGIDCEYIPVAQKVSAYADEIERLREVAVFLFGLLDDVDTADDVAKGDDKFYRNQIRAIHKRRFEVAETDGYNVKIKTALQQKDTE